MSQPESRSTLWERSLTAIAITFLVLGYYKMLSSAQTFSYEIYEREIFNQDSKKIIKSQKQELYFHNNYGRKEVHALLAVGELTSSLNNLLRKSLLVRIPYNMEEEVELNKKSYPTKFSSFDI